MTTAFMFPGQGSQAVGMGKSLADSFPAARAVFQEVDEALGQTLSAKTIDVECQAADKVLEARLELCRALCYIGTPNNRFTIRADQFCTAAWAMWRNDILHR